MVKIDPDQITRNLAAVQHTDDVVEYAIRCVLAMSPGLTDALQRQIEAAAALQVREVFGGDRCYISARDQRTRDDQIRRDYLAGERIPLLERRYSLKRSRLWEIIRK